MSVYIYTPFKAKHCVTGLLILYSAYLMWEREREEEEKEGGREGARERKKREREG